MNIREIQHRFNLEAKKYGITDPVQSTVIEDWVNYAYQNYITELYDKNKGQGDYFEMDERTSVILASLLADHTDNSFTSVTTNSAYGYYVQKPADFQYPVKESAILNYTDCNGSNATVRCKVIPMKHHQIESNINNPFLKPEFDEIWRVIYSDRIELIIYSGASLASYTFRYLKKQTAVNFNPVAPATGTFEIDSSVHEEIVLRAFNSFYFDLRKLDQNG